MIPMFSIIAIVTKNLKSRGIIVLLQPSIKTGSIIKANSFSMSVPIILNMVNGEKFSDGCSTASALIPTISTKRLILKPVIIIDGMLSVLFGMFLVPLRSAFNGSLARFSMILTLCLFLAFFTFFSRAFVKLGFRFVLLALIANHIVSSFGVSIIKSIYDYISVVKGKEQRPSRKGVGASVPKRTASRTDDDMVCSAWRQAAAL